MEAILKFDLNDPDEIKAHIRCVKATDMALVLWQIYHMRKELEWLEDQDKLTSTHVIDKILDAFNDHCINIDQIM